VSKKNTEWCPLKKATWVVAMLTRQRDQTTLSIAVGEGH
jgi:hypothetical protein